MLVAIVAAARDGQACARFCDGVFFRFSRAARRRRARRRRRRARRARRTNFISRARRVCTCCATTHKSGRRYRFTLRLFFVCSVNKALGDYRYSVVGWRNQTQVCRANCSFLNNARAQQPPQALARCAALPCVCVCRVQVSR